MVNLTCKTACALAVLVASATSVMAADSVELTVAGVITPAVCTPAFTGGGVIDYGDIKSIDLARDDYTVLPIRKVDFSVTCSAPAKFGIESISNRLGSSAGTVENVRGFGISPVQMFGKNIGVAGLGLAGGDKIGGYAVKVIDGSLEADGAKLQGIFSVDDGVSWRSANGAVVTSTALISWADLNGALLPKAMENFSAELEAQAYLNKGSELDLTQEIDLDGSMTLEVKYL